VPSSPVAISEGGVRGHWHAAAGASGNALVLTHGAGSSSGAPLLTAVAEALAALGTAVLRCDLPFRQAAPTGPPRAGWAPRDRDGLRAAIAVARRQAPGARVFLGGHSYGGRQASILAAEEPGLADALLLLSYPLHPPQRPTERRTAHFPQIRTPTLFVHGARDPFGSPEELQASLALIPAPTRLLTIEGAGHDLGRRLAAVAATTASAFAQLSA
jgi:predicted alpha/beta-hydrolase family hydrolase